MPQELVSPEILGQFVGEILDHLEKKGIVRVDREKLSSLNSILAFARSLLSPSASRKPVSCSNDNNYSD
jgi:hypothetical protein